MFKDLRPCLLILFATVFLFSCQKEYNPVGVVLPGNGSGGITGGTAVFKFKSALDTCTSPLISGNYKAGTAMVAANTITLTVSVDTIGTYTISSGSANGIKFYGAGAFTATGFQTIVLTATGTPIAAGKFNYTPGANGCTFSITVIAGTTGGGTGSSADCKACSYLPFCNTSTFTYIDSSAGASPVESTTLINIVKDTTIGGKVFQKYTDPLSDGYYNCTAGVTTTINYSVPSSAGIVTKIEQVPLQANLAAGTTWEYYIVNGIGQSVKYTCTMVAKGLSKKVLGVTYTDVIQVNQVSTISIAGFGDIIGSNADYYYANKIGLIDNVAYTIDPLSGDKMQVFHRVLKGYFIP